MSEKKSLRKRMRAPLLIMVLTILLSFLVPTILAQPANTSRDNQNDMPAPSDLSYNLDMYFTVVNYNEPSNPWVLINYYFDNGSSVRMVFGVDRNVFPSLNLDYQNNIIQIFDKKGKISGFGFQSKSRTNLFIYVPA